MTPTPLVSLTRSAADVAALHRAGLWRDTTLGDLLRRHAQERPDAAALVHGDTRLTFAAYRDRVAGLAGGLLARGIRPGERGAILLPNWPEFPIARLALTECGAVSVILNAASGAGELRAAIDAAGCGFVIAAHTHGRTSHLDLLGELERRWGRDRVLIAGDPEPPVGVPLAAVDGPPPSADTRHTADEIDDILFTSGTTGTPKGVLGCQNRWLSMCGNQRRAGGLGPADVGVVLSPVGGNIGYLKSTVLALVTGARVVLVDRIDPPAVWDLVDRERATYLVAVPTITHRLLAALEPGREFPSLRLIFNGGAPMPRALAEAVRDRLGCFLLTSLGTTEAGAVAGSHLGDTAEQQVATTGEVYPGSAIGVLVDGAVRRHGVGELVSRSSAAFDGYLGDPAATAALHDADGWLHHRDLVEIRPDGHVVFLGRDDDVINRGGVKVAPHEVEEALRGHSGVDAVAVVGVADADLGERVCAVLVPAGPPPTVDDLRTFLAGRGLARHKLPERLVVVAALPLSAAGKVDRRRLAALISAENDDGGGDRSGE